MIYPLPQIPIPDSLPSFGTTAPTPTPTQPQQQTTNTAPAMPSLVGPTHPTSTPTPTPKRLIKQGAEAHLYKTTFLSSSLPALLKHRPSKSYRHPVLDARLTKARCLGEARLLVRIAGMERERSGGVVGLLGGRTCKDGDGDGIKVVVPKVYFVDEARGEIYMEWIEGVTVREALDEVLNPHPPKDASSAPAPAPAAAQLDTLLPLMTSIGTTLSHLHNTLDVVHGDLTTSNIMLRQRQLLEAEGAVQRQEQEVILIDFGLGSVSTSEEDKAVDLYVLERAFISTHPRAEGLFREVLRAYVEGAEEGKRERAKVVMKRLAGVRMRGRKRSMIG